MLCCVVLTVLWAVKGGACWGNGGHQPLVAAASRRCHLKKPRANYNKTLTTNNTRPSSTHTTHTHTHHTHSSRLDEVRRRRHGDADRARREARGDLQVQRHVALVVLADEDVLDGLVEADAEPAVDDLAVQPRLEALPERRGALLARDRRARAEEAPGGWW